jgi:hypothetical protein
MTLIGYHHTITHHKEGIHTQEEEQEVREKTDQMSLQTIVGTMRREAITNSKRTIVIHGGSSISISIWWWWLCVEIAYRGSNKCKVDDWEIWAAIQSRNISTRRPAAASAAVIVGPATVDVGVDADDDDDDDDDEEGGAANNGSMALANHTDLTSGANILLIKVLRDGVTNVQHDGRPL